MMKKADFRKALRGRKAVVRVQGTESIHVPISKKIALELFDYTYGDVALFDFDNEDTEIAVNAMSLYGQTGIIE